MPASRQEADTNTVKDPDQWVSGDDPMTGAQASYLRTLSDEAHQTPPDDSITKAEASKRIEALKEELRLPEPRSPAKARR